MTSRGFRSYVSHGTVLVLIGRGDVFKRFIEALCRRAEGAVKRTKDDHNVNDFQQIDER